MFTKKQRSNKVSVAVGIALFVMLIGAAVPIKTWLELAEQTPKVLKIDGLMASKSAVKPLALLKPEEREAELKRLAKGDKKPDRVQARYLLAQDLLEAGKADEALQWLENLENDYSILAPYVLKTTARAYEVKGNPEKARDTWQALLDEYPDSPVAAEALYALGKSEPKYWDEAIARFPAHPRSVEIAQTLLKDNPDDLELLLPIAKHGIYLENYQSYLETLIEKHESRLTQENWEAIAFGYWEKQEYGKGAQAYARAPWTAQSAYRVARGRQVSGDKTGAIAAYKRLNFDFPDSEQTGLGLLRLIRLLEPKEAAPYIEEVLERFPERAPEALFERAELLDELGSKSSAEEARQAILSEYSDSEAAAKLRWSLAQQSATIKDFEEAKKWALQLREENPDSDLAAEAGFWAGLWAKRLEQDKQARAVFEDVLYNDTDSYYAWRSAVHLGWDVGDFTSVRDLNPEVVRQTERVEVPAGSEQLKELYQLAQDQDAWRLWQVEFTNRMDPTVAEQFTDGLIRLGVGDNLDALFMVSSLAWRDTPEERAEYKAIEQKPHYWEALYPFPYLDPILKWSRANELNPLLVTALIRQESRFMPKIRSVVGAVGLMQVMPETGEWVADSIGLKEYDLDNPNDNIRLGSWFLSFTHRQYKNNSMLAVASYNAGPGKVAEWVDEFGLTDPDEFVEQIPFPETKGYVINVFENYWNYLRLYNPEILNRLSGS
ncbi:lytic transglycosylase domain-containing protein [Phormidium sp. CCY1219]|uniref:lytic transglycosylase domain-containing protein n=1 Tax=Phormidium sp. CCY1219 TaxID=2886104 RepID=UPI002D1F1965|nr:transglycosylase SLT domain-containing protein [Phormidium sp. CCY1219]MEB3829172.1 transglycosylase SLT domain-containing protein [Phormidium sp. CCY1219]